MSVVCVIMYLCSYCFDAFSSKQFVALYDYDPFKSSPNPNPATELAFKEGDILRVFDTSRKDGFYVGKVLFFCLEKSIYAHCYEELTIRCIFGSWFQCVCASINVLLGNLTKMICFCQKQFLLSSAFLLDNF